MNRILSASIVPALLALASASTAACAAPTNEDGAIAAATGADPAAILAGEAGAPTSLVTGYALSATATSGKVTLVVADGTVSESYDVLSYGFGIERATATSATSGTADLSLGKATLSDVAITLRPNPSTKSLSRALLAGNHLKSARLLLSPAVEAGVKAPKPIELARFEEIGVRALATGAGNGTVVDAYALSYAKITLAYDGVEIGYDVRLQKPTCSVEPCPCANAPLGPYTAVSATTFAAPKGTLAVDGVSVAVSREDGEPIGSGASAGKSVLDGIEVTGKLERSAVCAFYTTAIGKSRSELAVGAMAPSSTTAKPYEATSWTACIASPRRVDIAWGGDAPRASIAFDAFGLLRRDRSIDPKTGMLVESPVAGWSFLDQKAITSCAEVDTH